MAVDADYAALLREVESLRASMRHARSILERMQRHEQAIEADVDHSTGRVVSDFREGYRSALSDYGRDLRGAIIEP